QDHAGGDGDVEALHVARHRNAREAVAVFAGEPAQALALAAEHQRDVAGEVEGVQRPVHVAGEAVDPDAELLQLAQAAREVAATDHRDAVGGAGRGLAHGGVDLHRLVPGDHHRGGAGGGRAAQAGTEVVRVLHAVEHQYQRAAFGGLDQLRQFMLVPGAGRCVARDRALVAQAAGDAVERLLRHPPHLDAEAARVALDLGDPRIPRPRLEQHLAHVLRVMLDRRSHRIDPRHPLTVLAHRDLERHIFQPQISLILKGFVRSRPASDPPTGQRTPQSQSFFHLWNLWLVFALLALGGLAAGRGCRGFDAAGVGDEAEVDLALLQAGLEHDDADAVAEAVLAAAALA